MPKRDAVQWLDRILEAFIEYVEDDDERGIPMHLLDECERACRDRGDDDRRELPEMD